MRKTGGRKAAQVATTGGFRRSSWRQQGLGDVVVVCLQIGLAMYVTDGDFFDYGYKVMDTPYLSSNYIFMLACNDSFS